MSLYILLASVLYVLAVPNLALSIIMRTFVNTNIKAMKTIEHLKEMINFFSDEKEQIFDYVHTY